MPERRLGDFKPQPLVDEGAAGVPSDITVDDEERAGEGAATFPGDPSVSVEADERLALTMTREEFRSVKKRELVDFAAELCHMVDRMGISFANNRNKSEKLDGRMRLAERRSRAELLLNIDEKGAIKKYEADGERKIGFTLGLEQAAISTLDPLWTDFLLGSGPRPNDFIAVGEADDSIDKERIIEEVADRYHERANVRQVIRAGILNAFRYPLSIIRCRWRETVRMRVNDEGILTEEIEEPGLWVQPWPIQWVYFSDINQRLARDQRLTIFYSEPSIGELENEEAVFDEQTEIAQDPITGQPILFKSVQTSGRFLDLERMRRALVDTDRGIIDQFFTREDRGKLFKWIENRREIDDDSSPGSRIGLIEAEGFLPLSSLVLEGTLTPDILDYYMGGSATIPGAARMGKRELGRMLSRIFWNMTITGEADLLQFEPEPYGIQASTALAAPYESSEGIYGRSVIDKAVLIADEMDRMANANIDIAIKRSDPNYLIDASAGISQDGQPLTKTEIQKVLSGHGEVIMVNGQIPIPELIKAIFPDLNPGWLTEFQWMADQLDNATGVTSELRGVGDADTATQAKQDLSQGQSRGLVRAEYWAKEVVEEIDRRLLRYLARFVPASGDPAEPGKWEKLVAEVAGAAGLKSWYTFPDVSKLHEEFKVVHAGEAGNNRLVRVNQTTQVAQLFVPFGTMDPLKAQGEILRLLRTKNPETWEARDKVARDPRQEIRAFANGHFLSPTDIEDAIRHYQVHVTQLVALDPDPSPDGSLGQLDPTLLTQIFPAEIPQVQAPPGLERFTFDPQIVIPQLTQHLIETEILVRRQLVAQFQAEQEEGKEAANGANGNNANSETTDESIAGGVARQGTQTPLPGVQG